MTNRTQTGLLLVVLAATLAGCDQANRPGPPTQPTPTATPALSPTPSPTGIRLAGTVADAVWRPLFGAKVEVVDGPQAGLSTTTDGNGRFSLAGSFDEATHFRATKDGHVAMTQSFPPRCAACNPNYWIHYSLETLAPRANLSGDYALTFIADSACTGLPDDARTATYEATLTLQSGPTIPANSWFTATVNGPTPLADNAFWIGLAGDHLAAGMGDAHGLAGLVWPVAPKTYLTFVDGDAVATVTDSSAISAVFSATVARCEVATDWGGRRNCESGEVVTHHQCRSGNHQLILRRR